MSKPTAIIGVADHYGWAVFVTATGDGTLVDRRRVELVDDGLTKYPYHHDAQVLPIKEAMELIDRVRVSAERCAKAALDAVANTVSTRIAGITLRACPQLPATVEERIKNYRAQCVADSVMYRQALAGAAEARGWAMHWYDAKNVIDVASDALGVENLDDHFFQVRKTIGPPWGKDHRVAMAAAIVAARPLE